MPPIFSTTKLPTVGALGTGFAWSNPTRITADDASDSLFFPGGSATGSIVGSVFDFSSIPSDAIIDGLGVLLDGSEGDATTSIALSLAGAVAKTAVDYNVIVGGIDDLWFTAPTPADLTGMTVTVTVEAFGASGSVSLDSLYLTVYWHIDMTAVPADVPTRVAYKVHSRDGYYLGELPKVSSPFVFTHDLNSAGATIDIVCATSPDTTASTDSLLTEDSLDLLTEDDLPILAVTVVIVLTEGNSDEFAVFKNSNRVKVWIYNYWYPNGKLMFSGQINRISYSYGDSQAVGVTVFSDGVDLSNYIARSSTYSYTTDLSQLTANGTSVVSNTGLPLKPTIVTASQTFKVSGGITNVGQISLELSGWGDVTVALKTSISGTVIGSITKWVNTSGLQVIDFQFSSLLAVTAGTTYCLTVSVENGQSISIRRNSTSVYADGKMYLNTTAQTGDLYFKTGYGIPSTTAAYTSVEPVTSMMSTILADYNNRGGYVTQRSFSNTGLSLTYTFNMATIFDALTKTIELSPSGYYAFIDLGTAEMDIQPTSLTADFTILRGNDINGLDVVYSIENVRNYLLFTGGDTGGGVNLFRDYQDSASAALYGQRVQARTDNRVTLPTTADAIGQVFVEENASEIQETVVTVLNKNIDITLLTNGQTIGFKNFGGHIDKMVLQIVRRTVNMSEGTVTLTLGKLQPTLSAVIQRINTELLNEQTLANPTSPS